MCIDSIRHTLGNWRYSRYKDRKYHINSLIQEIDKLIDRPRTDTSIERLRNASVEFGRLYNAEEMYWAQRSRIRWLKERDRNTRFFHIRATCRARKNYLDGIRDEEGRWIIDTKGICDVACAFFEGLFKPECNGCFENVQ